MESEDIVRQCLQVCVDHKGEDLKAYDVQNDSVLADYYLFVSGNSVPHLRALTRHLQRYCKDHGIRVRAVEGTPECEWVLMDCGDLLIHLFTVEKRAYYHIEALITKPRLVPLPPAAPPAPRAADR